MNKVILICDRDSNKITFELNVDQTCTEAVEAFKSFLLACTYQPESIKNAFENVAYDMDPKDTRCAD